MAAGPKAPIPDHHASTPRDEPGPALGVDPGSRRIGFALSDPGQTLATPLRTLSRGKQPPAEMILEVVSETGAVVVVVGLPLRLDGREGPEAKRSTALAAELEARGSPPVVLWDERFTSSLADTLLRAAGHSQRRRSEQRDQMAAAVLLQSYLDRSPGNDDSR